MKNEESSSLLDFALLGQLFEQCRPRLQAMLERRIDPALRARVGAEDVLNEAFLHARRRWPQFRQQGRENAYPWLFRITLDTLIEAWRRQTRQCRDLQQEMPWPDQSSVQLAMGIIHPGTTPTQHTVRQEMNERLRTALRLLSEKDREILWMRHGDELTHAETGEVLGITATDDSLAVWTKGHTPDGAGMSLESEGGRCDGCFPWLLMVKGVPRFVF